MNFSAFLRDWLAVPGRSAYKLSLDSGVSQSVIGRYVHPDEHRRVRPLPDSLKRLAPSLGVPYDDLMRLAGYHELQDAQDGVLEAQVDAELARRSERLAATLSRYPRAFWSVVLEVAEKMAALPDALPTSPRHSDPGFSPEPSDGPDGSGYYVLPSPSQPALARAA